MGLALYAARDGLGISPDSVEYIGVARNLLDGEGLTVPFGATGEEPFVGAPMTAFPPLYPLLLAAGGAGPAWALVLNLLLAAVTAVAVTNLVQRHVDNRFTAACMVALLFGYDFVRVHAQAWSEPLLLAVMAVGSLVLAWHLDRPRRATLVGLAAACAAAPMARYLGVAFVGAALVALAHRRRWRDAAVAAVAGAVPLGGWLAYGSSVVSDPFAAGRGPAWHPPPIGEVVTQAVETVGHYWASGPPPRYGALVLLLLLLTAAPRRSAHLLYAGMLVAGVVSVLLLTWALLDRTTVLDMRLLVAAHLGAVLALPSLLRPRRRWQSAALAIAAALVVVGGVRWGAGFPDSEARQYALDRWERSSTLRATKALPSDVELLSNGPDAVWWVTGRSAALLPAKYGLRTGEPRPWRERVATLPSGTVVVLLDDVRRDFLPASTEIEAVTRLRLRRRLDDGALYEVGGGGGI